MSDQITKVSLGRKVWILDDQLKMQDDLMGWDIQRSVQTCMILVAHKDIDTVWESYSRTHFKQSTWIRIHLTVDHFLVFYRAKLNRQSVWSLPAGSNISKGRLSTMRSKKSYKCNFNYVNCLLADLFRKNSVNKFSGLLLIVVQTVALKFGFF